MARGFAIVAFCIGLFVFFPLGCSGDETGPETCTSVAGLTFPAHTALLVLWVALGLSLLWLALARLAERRRGQRPPPEEPR